MLSTLTLKCVSVSDVRMHSKRQKKDEWMPQISVR